VISSVAVARAQWLRLAVDYAIAHAAPARQQIAAHLDTLAEERADSYFRGVADGVRLMTFITAAQPHWS